MNGSRLLSSHPEGSDPRNGGASNRGLRAVGLVVLAVLLTAGNAFAQLKLYCLHAEGGPTPAGETLDLGSVPSGDRSEVRLRLLNHSDSMVVLESLRAKGTGFSLDGHPSVPHTVAPGSNVDFRVVFRPNGFGSFSGTLRINDLQFYLSGRSPATISLALEEEGIHTPLSSGDTVLFGRVERNHGSTRRLLIENPTNSDLAVTDFYIEGSQFRFTETAPDTILIGPGETVPFEVRFEPSLAGVQRATLVVDQRYILLEGVGLHPEFSPPEIQLDAQEFHSCRQMGITLSLPSASPADGEGVLALAFHPSLQDVYDDPAVQFLANGGRAIPFQVTEGETSITFAGQPEVFLQTGTTAGTITLSAILGDQRTETSAAIAAENVRLESSLSWNIPTGLEIQLSGFDNTHSVSRITFQFQDTAGKMLTAAPIAVNVRDSFREYFVHSELGGLFSLIASFPVAGDTSLLGAVDIVLTNETGEGASHRLKLN